MPTDRPTAAPERGSHPTYAARRANRGFTLIELLVVIDIIVVLSAILFPVFAQAREKARQITCASDMRQLGIGFLQYSTDWDETMPIGLDYPHAGNGWAGQIFPYVKSAGVYKCPDDPMITQAPFTPVSFAYNENISVDPNAYGVTAPKPKGHIAAFAAPASTVMLFEVTGSQGNLASPDGDDASPHATSSNATYGSMTTSGADYLGVYAPGAGFDYHVCLAAANATGPLFGERSQAGSTNPTRSFSGYTARPRHGTGTNFLALDGHVKWSDPNAVSTGNTPDAPGQPQTTGLCGIGGPGFCAATTDNMTLPSGHKASLTFSTL
jgi:prepilin-type N-terminal cleavage/methylation domain-containing protein/prepilin-type processing-associated H-X9-DG protein